MADVSLSRHALPVGSIGRKSFGWWGMMTVIMTEASLFAYLLFTYYYLASQYGRDWVAELPKFGLSGPNTIILLLSSAFVWWAEQGAKRGRNSRLSIGLAIALVLGIAFVTIQLFEWRQKSFGLSSTSYGSTFFVTTGFHMAHVVVGDAMLAAALLWSLIGYFDERRYTPVSIAAVYWHFVDIVWLTIFFTFYVTPYLGVG